MPWFVWIILGTALLGSETIVDLQFYLVFPGVAALVIGAAGALGFEGQPWQEWLSFGVLSVIFLATFRGRVYGRFVDAAGIPPELIGEFATPTTRLEPGAVGKAELRGPTWTARNVGEQAIDADERSRVVRVEGLSVDLKRESEIHK